MTDSTQNTSIRLGDKYKEIAMRAAESVGQSSISAGIRYVLNEWEKSAEPNGKEANGTKKEPNS